MTLFRPSYLSLLWLFLIYISNRQPDKPIRQIIFAGISIGLLCGFTPVNYMPSAHAEELSEYRLKTAFLYNFATFTQWPQDDQPAFNVCIYGPNPFNGHLENLQDKKITNRPVNILFSQPINKLHDCHLVFISRPAITNLNDILDSLKDKPILTVADSPNACQKGVALNMAIENGKITFEANPAAAQAVGLSFSSQLLRFAKKVYSQ